MTTPAAALSARLAQEAEAVCRFYLSNGRRHGRYWLVGDARNTPGRSLYVGLTGESAGQWTDAASSEHGDLLDLIRIARGYTTLRETLDEARTFLRLPTHEASPSQPPAPAGSPEAATRLWASAQPIPGTLAEAYLRARGIAATGALPALRYHPACWYRPEPSATRQSWPALIGAVTDEAGTVTGVQRTWLARDGSSKAPLPTPRRAMGHLLGHGVRFGLAREVLAAGEGIETMLALQQALPTLPVIAALSSNHLGALSFPASLRRLYIARDNDAAGRAAVQRLTERAIAAGVQPHVLVPATNDFNADLCRLGVAALRARLAGQLVPEDAAAFIPSVAAGSG